MLLPQLLEFDEDFREDKVKNAWRLFKGKSTNHIDKVDSVESPTKGATQAQLSVPLVESLFLPDFPVRGDIEQQGFEVIRLADYRAEEDKTYCRKINQYFA